MDESKVSPMDPSANTAYNTAYTPGQAGMDMNGPPPAYPAYGAPASAPVGQQQVYTTAPITVASVGVSQNVMIRQGVAPPMPQNYIMHNVLVLLFCCFVFGIIGLIRGTQVSNLYITGNYAGAQQASEAARRWYVWGLVVGCCLISIFFVVFMILIFI